MGRTVLSLVLAVGMACLAPQAGYAQALVAHWTFDGNGLDSSGNHNDATAHGNVGYAGGMYGQAAQLHGNGDYFQIANNPGIQLLSGTEFSVSAYVKPAGLGQQNVLIHGLGCSTWASWFLGVQGGEPDAALSPGKYVFATRSSGGSAYTGATATATAGEWAHLAATHDGKTLKLYLNGEEQGSVAAPLPYNSAEALYIGGDPGCNGRSWYTGYVDDVYIFSRAMTISQVRQVASGITPAWLKANKPNPADGTVGVNMPLLQWTKGDTALFHNVYLGTTAQLTEANLVSPRQMFPMLYYVQGLQPGATYYWRVDEIDPAGAVETGDVWSFVAQGTTAYYPTPKDKANDAAPSGVLTWMPAAAATGDHVYLSDSLDAVTQGASGADKGTATGTTFTPTGLEPLKTYYWRVDETIAGGAVKTGPVWSFTTCLVVDDFESYTDKAGSEVFSAWIDGFTDGLSGSTVGYLTATNGTYGETQIVHGGKQSMPMDYNNVKSPFYSEVSREFSPVQDWTAGGVDTLILYVRGRLGDKAAPVYVTLEDSAKKAATVAYSDTSLTKTAQWTQWKIPLSQFTGVNPAKVKKLYIGVGDKKSPAAGGAGRIYVDDIELTKP